MDVVLCRLRPFTPSRQHPAPLHYATRSLTSGPITCRLGDHFRTLNVLRVQGTWGMCRGGVGRDLGNVVVDNKLHRGDIEPAPRHVCGHEHA
eukprot:388009-Rhodomonas_salina.1